MYTCAGYAIAIKHSFNVLIPVHIRESGHWNRAAAHLHTAVRRDSVVYDSLRNNTVFMCITI